MRVTADTNILVQAVVRDDKRQAEAAASLLWEAELIAVPLPCRCEFVWCCVGSMASASPTSRRATRLLEAGNVAIDRPAVDAGLAMFEAGGDFADRLIAHGGRWLGVEVFVSFDRKAVALIAGQGEQTRLLAQSFPITSHFPSTAI